MTSTTRTESGAPHDPAEGAESWRIGADLHAMTGELTQLGAQLQTLLDASIAPVVGEALAAVKRQHNRIAVLGQIKAGKSSFVNALVQRPNLLPADVNPWTAVVTRLHFAVPGQPSNGALFTFFGQDEWKRFTTDGGRLKELAGRLIPGYDPEEVQRQLAATRQRAETRLGQHYHRLFGKDRWYDTVTPDVIERYVCLGQHIDEPQSELISGRYADITKTADLYFEAEPFACPATVIDTPGTNDPALIRDEITLDSIDDADVYVVVLTAQQPLTTADLALLRILHGLRKNRIVVFINRMDDISGIDTGSRAILDGVRAVLNSEFPATEIPIVTGSALWANSALEMETADLDQIWVPELIAYARSIGALGASEPASLSGRNAISRERLSEVLYACSGMPQMVEHISNLMLKGTHGYWLTELGSTLLAAAESMTNSARNEAATLNKFLKKPDAENRMTANHARATTEMERLRKIAVEMRQFQYTADDWLRRETSDTLNGLRVELEREVTRFAASQAAAIPAAWLRGHSVQPWRCDALPLRSLMEERVLNAFWEVGKLLVDTQRQAIPELRRMLEAAVPDFVLQLSPTSLLNFNLTPSLTPLSKAVVFDLDDDWWQLWWRNAHSPAETARKIEDMIVAEFIPVAGELARSVETDLEVYLAAAIERFFGRCLGVVYTAIEREDKFARSTTALLDASIDAAAGHVSREHNERLNEVLQRINSGDRLIRALKVCMDRYAPMTWDEKRANR